MDAVPDGLACPSCGHRNRPGRKFCADCGTALAVSCPACGASNEPGERFCGECGSRIALGAPPPRTGVERRLVSVLFADLVGFTALSEGWDAEDVRELLSRYFELARTLIERHGGTVEKFIGDAVMAVWGTPTAREDDAERAVRTALELIPGVAAVGVEVGLPALAGRAAVLTGEAAVTLEADGEGMVAGDLVNSAARAQAVAEPGTVLVGEATHRATEAAIAYADAGLHELKGRGEPIHLWQALRVTAGRGGALKQDVLEPPFVGRERELRLLKELFHSSARERRAHLMFVVGIAGIGKSRLAWELQKYLDGLDQSVWWHEGRSLAYGEGVSFWALADMVRMRAGILEGEDPALARSKLREALELHVKDAEERAWIEPRLAHLLAIEERAGEQRDLFAGWRLFFERMAETAPVVLVLEDVQWADSALLEFLEYLLEWSRNHPIFVLALARPELDTRRPQWSTARNSTVLTLEPLTDAAMEALLDGFAPGLPEDLRHRVLERAEGVPLYAVETVRMLLDRGLLEPHDGGYRPTSPIEALDVPETLHSLVAARLDGLQPEERRVLEDASVLGKTVTISALSSVSALPEDELEPVLARLVSKEILSLESDARSPERGQYGFLQDLLRQIAYETLSRKERKARHLAVAAYLERESADGEDEVAEIVASHYLAALELDADAADAPEIAARARATLVAAAERAASLAANESAQQYFEHALELTDSILERAQLHEQAGAMAELGLRTEQARGHFEQAIAAFEKIGLDHPAARVTARLGILTWQQEHDIERGSATLERSFNLLAQDEPDADLAMLAVQLGRPLLFSGRLEEALERTEFALGIAEALQLPEVLSQGLTTKGTILESRGRREEAELLLRHALEVALAHHLSSAALRAYQNLTALLDQRDRKREALELSRAGVELARKVGSRTGEIALTIWSSAHLFDLGRWDEALAVEAELPEPSERVGLEMIALRLHRGERDEAAGRLAILERLVDRNEVQFRALLLAAEALVAFAYGRTEEALARTEEAVGARAELGIAHHGVKAALVAGLEAAFALGDEAKVDELLAIVEGLPPGELLPRLSAVWARFDARRAAMSGDGETATAGFFAAARIYEEIERPFDLAVVRLEHAEWLAGQGSFDEAKPLLDEAREILERLRATPWLERLATVEVRQPALLH